MLEDARKMAKILLCRVDEIYAGEILRVETGGLPPVAVYNLDGAFYTTDDTCTHGQAWLSQGFIDGDIIECPFHGGCFEIKTGQPVEPPCTEAIQSYDLVVEDGTIYALVET